MNIKFNLFPESSLTTVNGEEGWMIDHSFFPKKVVESALKDFANAENVVVVVGSPIMSPNELLRIIKDIEGVEGIPCNTLMTEGNDTLSFKVPEELVGKLYDKFPEANRGVSISSGRARSKRRFK